MSLGQTVGADRRGTDGTPMEGFAVHPLSTEDVRGPTGAIGSDQADPRHPANSA